MYKNNIDDNNCFLSWFINDRVSNENVINTDAGIKIMSKYTSVEKILYYDR